MATAVDCLNEEKKIDTQQEGMSYPRPAIAWTIWGCAALFYLYEYVLRVAPSVMTEELAHDFGLNSTALGFMVSMYYLAYVPLQIPCGVIVDWLGVRRVVTFSALLCVVGSFLFATSDNLIVAHGARFLIGAGSACGFLSCTKLGADWFHPEKFAVIAGLTMMMGTLGGVFGNKPCAMLVNATGWHQAMILGSIAGVVVMVLAWVIIRDRNPFSGEISSSPSSGKSKNTLLDGLLMIRYKPQIWLIGLYGGLMYVPISAFAELWGVPYIMKAYGIDKELASYGGTMVFIGMALGSPLGAMLSNKIKSRVKVMSWSALTTMMAFLAAIYLPNLPLYVSFALLFLGGLCCGGQILYFAAAKELMPLQYSGTAIGFTNACVMLSGIVFQPLLGWLIDLAWDGIQDADGLPIYSIDHYKQALISIPICLVAAWVLMLFVKETYTEEAA